ncbi:hypothetical protein [Mesorhizobium sp. WSM3882]|uniref:hypothetical protein n=1 Tax=Mesorhizobium sp. WSM3882 TaxID=2029407 RepID=UPI000BAF634F|nr:hypothetical protein [Mesorhizobium sp. WSM3882]PBB29208.1 hypothetical protein CK214_26400 [Mesorhizobium sp. WSM3882]
MDLTAHASIRAQQRGIPVKVVAHLYRFGETKNSRGATSLFVTRKSLEEAAGELTKQEIQNLRRYSNSYLVIGENERVITVARSRQKSHS